MEPELIFKIANTVALAGWVLLIFLPVARITQILLFGLVIPLLLAVTYVGLIGLYIGQAEGGFGSLMDVALLFQHPQILLAGWVHYLCFDLMIGVWESADARKCGISRWIVAPCQILTFLFGPAGMLAYVIVRTVHTRQYPPEFP